MIQVIDGDVEQAIRQLRKLSAQHLAEIKYRYLNPKKSERKKSKENRANRRRIKHEVRFKRLQERHDRWLMVQRKRENRKRRMELHGGGD